MTAAVTDTEPPRGARTQLAAQRGPHESSLRGRVPGQALMSAVLEKQRQTGPRSMLARLIGASPLTPDARPWYSGALGEITVGKVLATLGAEWVVLHSVPVGEGDADIDHVVIGPAGVVTMNTKHHPGHRVWVADRIFMVAGHKLPYIPKAASEADRAAKSLKLSDSGEASSVRAVVVVVDAKQLTVKRKTSKVAVLQHQQLVRWLKRLPATLSQEEVGRLAAKADLPSTWREGPHDEPTGAASLQAAFAGVHKEVRGARRVRLAWAAGAYGSAAAGVAVLGPELVSALVQALLH